MFNKAQKPATRKPAGCFTAKIGGTFWFSSVQTKLIDGLLFSFQNKYFVYHLILVISFMFFWYPPNFGCTLSHANLLVL